MKIRILLSTTLLAGAMVANAAKPVGEAQPLDLGHAAFHPVLSADGTRMLFTTVDHRGLSIVDLATLDEHVISTEAGAGFQPLFTADGSEVVYRTATQIDGLLNRDVRSYSVAKAVSRELQPYSRNQVVMEKAAGKQSFARAEMTRIEVVKEGRSTEVNPLQGADRYQWASVSPDGQRVLFLEPFKGVYVCNLDGSNPVRVLGNRSIYPCWIDDNTIAAVTTTDDGYQVLSSQLVYVDLASGAVTPVTSADMQVSELASCPAKRMIVFNDMDGNLFTLSFE
ncbi:MAG: hypothetical protein LIP02_03175 [Bacteroidales bacterium]|nr:hypothetical protein [Bacteroidales bacterium]